MSVRMSNPAAMLAVIVATLGAPAAGTAQYDFNQCLLLDGARNYVKVPAGYLPQLSGRLTIDAWVRTSQATGRQTIVARYRQGSTKPSDSAFDLSLVNGAPRFEIIASGVQQAISASNAFIADSEWHHVAGFYNGRELRIYVDGTCRKEVSAGGGVANPPRTDLRIGAMDGSGGAAYLFKGQIDEVRLWPGDVDVATLHRHPVRESSDTYRVYAWRFNGGSDMGFNAQFVGYAGNPILRGRGGYARDDFALALGDSYFSRSYVEILGGESLHPGDELTIEATVHAFRDAYTRNAHGTGEQAIVSKFAHNSGLSTDDSFYLGLDEHGYAKFQVQTDTGWAIIRSGLPLFNGTHHVAASFANGRMSLFVDGALVVSASKTGRLRAAPKTPLLIGATQEGTQLSTDRFFLGSIDDVRIWTGGRTAAQIQEGRTTLTQTSGLVARWRFEGDFANETSRTASFQRYRGLPRGLTFFVDDRDAPFARDRMWTRSSPYLPGPPLNNYPPNGLGRKKIAVILFNFATNPIQPFTPSEILHRSMIDAFSTRSLVSAMSFGQLRLAGHLHPDGDVFGWYTLPGTETYTPNLESELNRRAAADGFDVANYDAVLYTHPYPSVWAGQAFGGASGKAIEMSGFGSATAAHEIFHILGINHANALICTQNGSRVTLSRQFQISGYGDPFCSQGFSGGAHLNCVFKARMGWYQTRNVLTHRIRGAMNFKIVPSETPSTGLQCLRIPLPRTTIPLTYAWDPMNKAELFYYVEFRRADRFNRFSELNATANGVSIRIAPDIAATDITLLLDNMPGTATFEDAALRPGARFVDLVSGITIETLSVDPTGATIRVTQ